MKNSNEIKNNTASAGSTDDINTSLYEACLRGKTEIAKTLLENGADVHEKFDHDNTALYAAVISANLEIVELLLQHGADVNTKCNHDRESVLYIAVKHNDYDITQLLLDKGANVNTKCTESKEVFTALTTASKCYNHEIVKLLLNRGAYVDGPYKNGSQESTTVLDYMLRAVSDTYRNDDDLRSTIEVLLQHGAHLKLPESDHDQQILGDQSHNDTLGDF